MTDAVGTVKVDLSRLSRDVNEAGNITSPQTKTSPKTSPRGANIKKTAAKTPIEGPEGIEKLLSLQNEFKEEYLHRSIT